MKWTQLTYKKYKISIKLKTGLHIGAGNDDLKIGGIDNPVIKLKDNKPYIPGTSLKGKLRYLLENSKDFQDLIKKYEYNIQLEQSEEVNINDPIQRFFGPKHANYLPIFGPTRFLFRDIELSKKDKKRFDELSYDFEKNFYENKAEIVIGPNKTTPRFIERVPAGTTFEGELIIRLFDQFESEKEDNFKVDPDKITKDIKLFNQTFENLSILEELLKNDYLGGNGSRGYGAVIITFEAL